MLSIALLVLLCFAFLDKIPDPPGIIKHLNAGSELAASYHAEPVIPATPLLRAIIGPEDSILRAITFTPEPAGFNSTALLNLAADSSPPVNSR